jgi:uncharacterized protein YktA (UPF0223 family)
MQKVLRNMRKLAASKIKVEQDYLREMREIKRLVPSKSCEKKTWTIKKN